MVASFPRVICCIGLLAPVLTAPPAFAATPGDAVIDRSTLTDKVVSGYQGWFRAPGDGSRPGDQWTHWGNGGLGPGNYTIDMWPDLSECDPDELFVNPNVLLTNGETGALYSSVTNQTVERHFRWMKETGIDGVFLQRFINSVATGADRFESANMVVENIMSGANLHGRGWALEYDTSGSNNTVVYDQLTNDWKYLVDAHGILDDPAYLHHEGKPVVIIWGFGFPSRGFSPAVAAQVIDFFQNDPVYGGNYVMGGVPTGWRDLSRDADPDPGWAPVYRSFDAILPWTVGRFNSPSGAVNHAANYWAPDLAECTALGIEYMPVVFPGFSWDNLQNLPAGDSLIPRLGGDFIWTQMHGAADIGAEMMFVAMFDEVDEGTAIFKVDDVHPTTDNWVTYNGLPHDWYMRLAGAAAGMLRGTVPIIEDFPIDPDVSGLEAHHEFADSSGVNLQQVSVPDGDTLFTGIGGRACHRPADPATDLYVYFAIDDNFILDGSDPEVSIYVDYYDVGTNALRVQYEALGGVTYKSTPAQAFTNSGAWKRAIFPITDARFNNGQNGSADFRVQFTAGTPFYIGRVTVATKQPLPADMIVTAKSAGSIVGATIPLQAELFSVFNPGAEPLNFSVTSDQDWLTPTPANARTAGDREPIGVLVDTGQVGIGLHTATLTVSDDAGVFPPQQVTTTVLVLPTEQVWVDLGGTGPGSPDIENGLKRPNTDPGDGTTTQAFVGGVYCRRTVNATDNYMYFQVDNNFPANGFVSPLYLTLEYFDNGVGSIKVQYDSPASAYTNGGSVQLDGSNTWRFGTIEIGDALFAGRQNGQSDFRLPFTVDPLTLNTVQLDTLIVSDCTLLMTPISASYVITAGATLGPDSLAIHAVSAGDLTASLSSNATWLRPVRDAVRANQPASVYVEYDAAGLAPGDYAATLSLTAASCSGASETFDVSLRVLPADAALFDLDGDGDIDGTDWSLAESCLTGPDIAITGVCSPGPDVDMDDDFDVADFKRMQVCSNGIGGFPACD